MNPFPILNALPTDPSKSRIKMPLNFNYHFKSTKITMEHTTRGAEGFPLEGNCDRAIPRLDVFNRRSHLHTTEGSAQQPKEQHENLTEADGPSPRQDPLRNEIPEDGTQRVQPEMKQQPRELQGDQTAANAWIMEDDHGNQYRVRSEIASQTRAVKSSWYFYQQEFFPESPEYEEEPV
jgi:hypothetical protein